MSYFCDPKTITQVPRDQYDSVFSKLDDNYLVDDSVTLFDRKQRISKHY